MRCGGWLRPSSSAVKPGFLLTTSDQIPAGIPVDFKARLTAGSVYVDGFVGPWFFFKGDVVRLHVGHGRGPALRPIAPRR